MDSSVIAAIAAVQASPDNLALRVHLATLLAQAERWVESLEQAQTILAQQPDHLEALELATRACETLGENERAESYRRLLKALGGKAPEPVKSESSSQPDLNTIPRFTEDGRPIPRFSDNGVSQPEAIKLTTEASEEILEYEVEGPKVTLADVAIMQEVNSIDELTSSRFPPSLIACV